MRWAVVGHSQPIQMHGWQHCDVVTMHAFCAQCDLVDCL